MSAGAGAARPGAGRSRAVIGWFQTTRHRCRGLRWAAAAGAAACVLVVLGSAGGERPQAQPGEAGSGPAAHPASRLPAGTRGVIVDAAWDGFKAGDIADVHAASTGLRVAAGVEVVDAAADRDKAVIAVRPDRVASVIDAIAGGGVVLVLAPGPGPAP